MDFNELLFSTPVFGILISLTVFIFFSKLFTRFRNPLFSPLLFSVFLVGLIITVFSIPLEDYNRGGDIITFFLGPTTVALAVPLYKKIDQLKRNFIPIIIGITVGSVAAIVSVVLLGKLFGLDEVLLLSLAPKSTTTAIATEVSRGLGGDPSLTLAFVNVAGLSGYAIGGVIMKLIDVKSPIAKGVALGTASHAVGTNKAIEMGELEGAMSSLSIGLTGVITALVIPFVLNVIL